MAAKYPVCFCLLLAFVFCQTALGQKLSAGFSAGPSFSTLRYNDPAQLPFDLNFDPFDFKTGFIVAANGTVHFNSSTALRAEVNFERRGGKSGVELSDGNGQPLPDLTLQEHFDYVQVPVLLQLSAGNGAMFLAHFGFSFDYLVHRTSKFPGQIIVQTDSKTYVLDMPSDFLKYDVSLVGGVGASLPLSDWINLQLMARVNSGLKNLNKDEAGFEVKNLSIAAMATVQFTLQ
ncbi:MAG: PorT family protein [Lewinellaceae bacterium]|nr:PorT family protein [Lewinellaceae bacterium]